MCDGLDDAGKVLVRFDEGGQKQRVRADWTTVIEPAPGFAGPMCAAKAKIGAVVMTYADTSGGKSDERHSAMLCADGIDAEGKVQVRIDHAGERQDVPIDWVLALRAPPESAGSKMTAALAKTGATPALRRRRRVPPRSPAAGCLVITHAKMGPEATKSDQMIVGALVCSASTPPATGWPAHSLCCRRRPTASTATARSGCAMRRVATRNSLSRHRGQRSCGPPGWDARPAASRQAAVRTL